MEKTYAYHKIDLLEYIADCVMAGMARSGDVYEIQAPNELLRKAFDNTVVLLKNQVKVCAPAASAKGE